MIVPAHHRGASTPWNRLYAIRATVSVWIADPQVQVILSTGGTGFTGREKIIKPQLDITNEPCNLAELFARFLEA